MGQLFAILGEFSNNLLLCEYNKLKNEKYTGSLDWMTLDIWLLFAGGRVKHLNKARALLFELKVFFGLSYIAVMDQFV